MTIAREEALAKVPENKMKPKKKTIEKEECDLCCRGCSKDCYF